MATNISRSTRLVKVRTPGSRVSIQNRKRKSYDVSCGGCGKKLAGVSSNPRLAKSMKTPSRPYGGNLCSSCSRERIRGW